MSKYTNAELILWLQRSRELIRETVGCVALASVEDAIDHASRVIEAADKRIEKALREQVAEVDGVRLSNWKLANDFAGEITALQKHIAELTGQLDALKQQEPTRNTEYVECRECRECGHAGINDSAPNMAACTDCGWSGGSPEEDKCPECNRIGTMTSKCPCCPGQYRLVADAEISTATPQAAPVTADLSDEEIFRIEKKFTSYPKGVPWRLDVIGFARAILARSAVQQTTTYLSNEPKPICYGLDDCSSMQMVTCPVSESCGSPESLAHYEEMKRREVEQQTAQPAELSDIDAIANRIAYRIIKAGVSTHSGIFSTVRLSLNMERIKKRIEWIDISQQKPPDYIPVRIKLSTGTELTGQRLNASWHFAEAVSPADEDATVTHWQSISAH